MGFDPSPGGLWFADRGKQDLVRMAGYSIPKEKKSYAGVDHSSNEGIRGAQAAPDSRVFFFCRQLHAMTYICSWGNYMWIPIFFLLILEGAGVFSFGYDCQPSSVGRKSFLPWPGVAGDIVDPKKYVLEIIPGMAWGRKGGNVDQLGQPRSERVYTIICTSHIQNYTNIIKYYRIHTIFSMRCSMAASLYLTYQVGLKIPDVESVSSSMLLVHWSADPSNPSCRGSFCDKQILTGLFESYCVPENPAVDRNSEFPD